jgi:hypothetical protein
MTDGWAARVWNVNKGKDRSVATVDGSGSGPESSDKP